MVKGISKQVLLVRSPEKGLYEQAIFILRDDAVRGSVTEEQLLREASEAVLPEKRSAVPRFVWMLLGALLSSGVWIAAILIG